MSAADQPLAASDPPSGARRGLQDNSSIGELEGTCSINRHSTGDRLDNGRQHGFGGKRGFQASSQPRDDAVGLVTVLIQQVVDGLLEASAQGLKQHGDQTCRQQGDAQVAMCLKEHAEANYDQDVNGDDAYREHAIDQYAVDEQVNVPGPIAQQGEAAQAIYHAR